jgi:hypothetical protein
MPLYSFVDFPDQIKVKIGEGWVIPFPIGFTCLFAYDEEIILKKVSEIYNEESVRGELLYTESGIDEEPSATNRLKIVYFSRMDYENPNLDFKGLMIQTYINAIYGWRDIITEMDLIPDNTAHVFNDIYLMESRFSITEFGYVEPDLNGFIDLNEFKEKNWLNPALFKSMEAVIEQLPISKTLPSINSIGINITDKYLTSLNSFGIQKRLEKLPSMGIQRSIPAINSIGFYLQKLLTSVNSLGGTVIQKVLRCLNQIDGTNYINKTLPALNAIGSIGQTTIYPTIVAWDIILDGASIKNKIQDLSIQISEFNMHNSFSFNSIDPKLYQTCNPENDRGTHRITITVGARTFYFLVEQRTGNRDLFSVFGRSLTALLDAPFSDILDYTLSSPDSASNVAQDIADTLTVDYDIDDFILPDDFSFNGIRIEGLNLICNTLGAVLRSKDNGDVLLRYLLPVRPVDLSAATPVIEYDSDSNLISLDYQESQGTHENIIQVDGKATDIELPTLEVEDSANGTSSHIIGEDIFVRAFWGVANPPAITEMYSTDGQCKLMSNATTETKIQTVTFEDGKATTQYPITGITAIEWIGKSGGSDATFKKYSSEIYITETDIRLAKITYTTVYQKYKIYGHTKEDIIFVLVVNSSDISIQINMSAADKEAGSIQKDYIKDPALLAKIGRNYLDENSYDKFETTFEAPYNALAVDGAVVSIHDEKILLTGNFLIKDADILFSGPKVTNKIRAVKYII